MKLTPLALDSAGDRSEYRAAVARASAYGLFYTGWQHLRWSTDSAEAALAPLRALAQGDAQVQDAYPGVSDPVLRGRFLVMVLAFRGHLDAAGRAMDYRRELPRFTRSAVLADPFAELAQFGVVPDSLAEQEFARAFVDSVSWGGTPEPLFMRHLPGAPWWAAHGDTLSLRRLAERALHVSQVGDPVVARPRGRYLHAAGLAWLALVRGDSVEAGGVWAPSRTPSAR